MDKLGKRDYSFDALRGFCMWLIVFQHFIHQNRDFDFLKMDGYLYFLIDLFVMQIFFFLSGYFSKNPDRGREIAFSSLLWPVLIGMAIMAVLIAVTNYPYPMHLDRPPYAMWFLVCLFYYRLFQKNYVRIPHLFGWAFLLSLTVGFIWDVDSRYALAKAFNWFPYFLLGYYCRTEDMARIRRLKWWQTTVLGVVLLGGTWLFLQYGPVINYRSVQLYSSNEKMELLWWEGILLRLIIFVVSSLFIIVALNLFKNKKGLWSHIGQNTMPVYIFHIFLVLVMYLHHDNGMGLFTPPANNTVVYYMFVIAFSMAVTLILTTRPFRYLYNLIFVRSYEGFIYLVRKPGKRLARGVERVLLFLGDISQKEV